MRRNKVEAILVGMIGMLLAAGCVTTDESAGRDQLSTNVGQYTAAPSGVEKPRVGVPQFSVDTDPYGFSVSGHELERIAADQMSTLLYKSRRFNVIERAQLRQLLREQDLEGIVKPGELAQMGQVRGVDYLLLGKITNFRFTRERGQTDFNVAGRVARDFLDGINLKLDQDEVNLTTELGVDIRLVDPATGEIKVAEFSEFERTDTASGFGVKVAGLSGGSDAKVSLGADDAGQVLRLAFDDALRKMMPEIDRFLTTTDRSGAASTAVVPTTTSSPASDSSPSTPKFCSQCGTKLAAGAKFCGTCGTKVSHGHVSE